MESFLDLIGNAWQGTLNALGTGKLSLAIRYVIKKIWYLRPN